MTAIGVFATLCNVYGDSTFRFDRVYIYTTAITNVSQVSPPPDLVQNPTNCHLPDIRTISHVEVCQPLHSSQTLPAIEVPPPPPPD